MAIRIMAFFSGRVGIGTTLIIASLGRALAKMSKSVIEIDTDSGEISLSAYIGMRDQFKADLIDGLDERCSIRQVLVRVEKHNDLYMLHLAKKLTARANQTLGLIRVCGQLRGECDFILIASGINEV